MAATEGIVGGGYSEGHPQFLHSHSSLLEEGRISTASCELNTTSIPIYPSNPCIQGSLCGALEMFDCYLKRVLYNKKFEMTYVALSQVNNNNNNN